MAQVAQREFSGDPRVTEDRTVAEKASQGRVS